MTIIKTCFYCKNCEVFTKLSNTKLSNYGKVFNELGFWTFNKHIRCWSVFDPEWSYQNNFFELFPIRG